MDSITHIVLGACVGEGLLGKSIGKRAMILGAAAQSIPDIDFVASFWLNNTEDLLAHRGFTHSFLFALLVCPALGIVAQRQLWPQVHIRKWISFFLIEVFIHLFLDAFNNYGVGWFEPFSNARISFQAIYVADPLLTIFPLVATTALLIIPANKHRARYKWWRTAIIASSIYLGITIFNKLYIDYSARKAFSQQHIMHESYFTTPAPLQNLLWMVVAGNDEGFHVGFRSVMDSDPHINFRFFPKNEHLLDSVQDHEEISLLKRFSQGFYTIEKWGDTLVFNDLRFGQIIGWHDPAERFVFHYFLHHPESNELVVQRGRFAKWNLDAAGSFWRRMWGRKAERVIEESK